MAKLCPKGKAAAKRKFKVYPSAYANMYASGVCSGKITPGGKKGSRKKAAMGGLNGEIEHASAFIHTLRFGNKFRDAVGGTSYLSFTNTRGPAGAKISIPMMHKTDAGLRPFYLTHEFTIHDAPNEDEIVVAIGGAPTGRAHARTGDRYQDMKEMGIDN